MRKVLPLILTTTLCVQANAAPRSEPMQFASDSCCGNGGIEWITADGDITDETPARFVAFLSETNSANFPRTIQLNSNGGSLFAAMKFGRLIRKLGFSTSIWGSNSSEQTPDEKIDKGTCASACAYAFLGGVERSVDPQNRYGLHQFFSEKQLQNVDTKAFTGLDISSVQLATGVIAGYVAEMGADAHIIEIAAKTSPGSMTFLTYEQMKEFRIESKPKQMDPWQITLKKGAVIAHRNL